MPNERFGLIAVIRVPGTNHVLSGTKARGTVLYAVEAWALEHFAKRPAQRTDHLGDVVALGQTGNGVAA
jgi:hypothetical protein